METVSETEAKPKRNRSETEAKPKRNRSDFEIRSEFASQNDESRFDREVILVYKSMYEAMKSLPENNRLEVYDAIFGYGFDQIEPDLSGISRSIWILIHPILAKSHRNFLNGKRKKFSMLSNSGDENSGAKPKRTRSETEAKPERNRSETEAKPERNGSYYIKDKGYKDIRKEEEKKATKKVSLGGDAQDDVPDTQRAGGGAPVEPQPRKRSFKSWNREELAEAVMPFLDKFGQALCDEFVGYWGESTPSGIRVNGETAFDIDRRLITFRQNKLTNFGRNPKPPTTQTQQKFLTKAESEQYVIDTYFRGRREISGLAMGIPLTDAKDQPRPIEDIKADMLKQTMNAQP